MILSILEKYKMPLFAPDGEGASPGAAGPTGGDVGGATSGGSPEPASGNADAPGGTPSDPGSGDGSFALSDDVMYSEDLDFVAEVEPEPTDPQGQPQAPPTATPTTPAQQQAPAPTAAQPQQPASPTNQPTVAQPGGAGPQQPLSPTQMLQQMVQNRDQLIDHLSSNRFALTKADEEAMETNAIGHIPKLLARTYFDAFTSAVNFMNQQVPGMITSQVESAAADRQAEDSFYTAWPGLDRGKHNADVLAYATAFRQMNPQASLEDAVKFVGAAVATKHGIANAGVRPASPTANRGNGRRSPPFAPGMGSRAAPTAQRQVEASPFEGLGFDFD